MSHGWEGWTPPGNAALICRSIPQPDTSKHLSGASLFQVWCCTHSPNGLLSAVRHFLRTRRDAYLHELRFSEGTSCWLSINLGSGTHKCKTQAPPSRSWVSQSGDRCETADGRCDPRTIPQQRWEVETEGVTQFMDGR